MRILLTNDDGIHAVGLRALNQALLEAGHEVQVVAPLTEQSAVGHAVTLTTPLRVKELVEPGARFRGLGVTGTPVDCVKLALTTLMAHAKPDVVVSGINAGANVGVDILYSGTVSAATEGAILGFPAMAVSFDHPAPGDLSAQAEHAAGLLERIPWSALPPACLVNCNYPNRPMSETLGLKVCRHTRVMYNDWYEERRDPRGRPYYWINGVIPEDKVSAGTDRALLSQGWVTLTPLRFNFNEPSALELLGPLGQ